MSVYDTVDVSNTWEVKQPAGLHIHMKLPAIGHFQAPGLSLTMFASRAEPPGLVSRFTDMMTGILKLDQLLRRS